VFITAAAILLTPPLVTAQPNQFQFVVGASDSSGAPVTDLKTTEVVMTENGAPATIVKVEPYRIPVKLTIAVDNGADSSEALAHYRTGLAALVETLPADVEVTLIATAPQPRTLIRASTDRVRIARAISSFAPENERPRFTDAIVEFAKGLEKELKDKRGVPDSLPILLMVSTTANEATSYQLPEIEKALNLLVSRRARLMVAITSTRANDATAAADINTNRQAIIAIPATKATRGRYEAIAISNRLNTLLPDMGREIAALHRKHVNQFRVTVERPNRLTGPLQTLNVELSRPGLTGSVSGDGLP
jgi:hypothetical protein